MGEQAERIDGCGYYVSDDDYYLNPMLHIKKANKLAELPKTVDRLARCRRQIAALEAGADDTELRARERRFEGWIANSGRTRIVGPKTKYIAVFRKGSDRVILKPVNGNTKHLPNPPA
jgi:hypothetical protein